MTFYDLAYWTGLGVSAPYWGLQPTTRAKVLRALRERTGEVPARATASHAPSVLIHAVSLGEVNATRMLVEMLRAARPDLHVVLSTTTDTGFARGKEVYGRSIGTTVVRFPLDFSKNVDRLLDAVDPDVAVLMELELWPNFMKRCERRGVPVVLANGRMTTGSFRNYRLGGPFTKRMFRRLAVACAQDQAYAERFRKCGVPERRVIVTGTMKFDTAHIADRIDGDRDLAASVGLRPGTELVWVCGSTGRGEEPIILGEYRKLLMKFPRLRLVIVPRKPERFDEVEQLIVAARFRCVRRSKPIVFWDEPVPSVILGDTMGELRTFYSLADVVFVGRSLIDLGPRQHGSDMIEPAALGKACVVGPYTGNFAYPVRRLKGAGALLEVNDGPGLSEAVSVILSTPGEARRMGQAGQTAVRFEQGATGRHAKIVLEILNKQVGEFQPPHA
ncbi:MAG TPA: 3-deoxy-D-manno-octulosonic acid transferase [Tepidisphaeraceae bacterium]|nr:3-deoxy-D-manno-octulosonic acid transferase [Tepidisphaeraceae bacterium]